MNDDHARVVLDRLLTERHSCRAFQPRPVPRATIEAVLASSARAASWCNAQPWEVHIVGGQALERLRTGLALQAVSNTPPAPELDWPKEYQGIYGDRRRACGWALYGAVGVAKGDREASKRQTDENFRLFGAPHLAVLTSDRMLGTHGVMDCGGWLANFMLAATAHGIATVAQAAIASWPDVLRSNMPIAENRVIICGISFGYADADHPANSYRTARAPVAEFAHWHE